MSNETNLKNFLENLEHMMGTNNEEQYGDGKKYGVIQSYKDGVIVIKGLENLKMGEVVTVQNTKIQALVLNLEKDVASALVLQAGEGIKEGLFVESNNVTLSIPVSQDLIGRVIDPLGTPLDEKGKIQWEKRYAHEKIAPGVMVRKSVDTPVQTGILAIDSLIPVGRGQRELIIGDRQTGKTTIALDTIINQKNQNMICIYVGIGQREARMAQVYETLKKNDAMEYTIIVSASASNSAAMQFLAPYAGCAVGEYFMDMGKDVLIIYDDLSKHAVAYREMSLLLRRPPGREAYPGDVFYLHSRLLERSARLNEKNGGGSLTALPIIETQAGDVSAYIPTNVISITDGQIFLKTDLFNKGIKPAIDVGISVSRVGGSAQTKIMKKVSGKIKLELAQYYELQAFSQFASELDESTKKQLTRGERIVEVLKQNRNTPYALWKEVVLLYAVTNGFFDSVLAKDMKDKIIIFLSMVESKYYGLVQSIENDKDLTDTIKQDLETMTKDLLAQ